MEAILKSPDETAPMLMKVGTKAVEWDGQTQDVEGILDKHLFSIQSEHGSALTKDWDEGVVSHVDTEIGNVLLRNES